MDHDLARRLAALAPLDPAGRRAGTLTCKLCGGRAPFFDVVDLNKHCSKEDPYAFGASGIAVPYHRCTACGFLFTAFFDDWTPEDFARHIYNADYIKVDAEYADVRPLHAAGVIAAHMQGCEHLAILDYGSGTGVFADAMRRRGFLDVDNYDPFSSPGRPKRRYDIITCFEVIEHTPSPLETVLDMKTFLGEGGSIVFSQTLQPDDIERLRGAWWYLAPRNGHISTFTADALAVIAERAGLVLRGTDSPYAFSRDADEMKAAFLVGAIGLPVYSRTLEAPGPSVSYNGALIFGDEVWYDIEPINDAMMRWARVPRITWPAIVLPRFPARLMVLIPLVDQVRAGFIETCRVEVDGAPVACRYLPSGIAFELTVTSERPVVVTLVMPAMLVPRDLRDVADERPLGVAVRAAAA